MTADEINHIWVTNAHKLRAWVASEAWLSDMDRARYLEWAEDFETRASSEAPTIGTAE